MSKQLSFSRTFPKGHQRAGEPTYFVQHILRSLYDMEGDVPKIDHNGIARLGLSEYPYGQLDVAFKLHTCRPMFTASGKVACKAGDKYDFFSWEGTPYRSKQIVWARDVEIVRVVPLMIISWNTIAFGDKHYFIENGDCELMIESLAANDGLSVPDFIAWMECTKSVGVPLAIRIWDDNGLGY